MFGLDVCKARPALRILREHGSDERTWEVRQFHSTEEASEQGQWCATVCGGSGGKGTDQGESGSTNQVPDTDAGETCNTRWYGYGRHNACASIPEVGAQCGSSACWDLCGGCRVTGIPTASTFDPCN